MIRVAKSKAPVRRTATASRPLSSEAVQRFRKVLELELRRGCDDSAVFGGLDQFLRISAQDANVAAILGAEAKLAKGYGALGVTARRKWLTALLEAKGVAPKQTKAAAQKERRRANAAVEKKVEPPADPLDSPVTVIKGVKAALKIKLAKLGLHTVRDLLYFFPHRHNDFGDVRTIAELEVGEEQTTIVSVWSATATRFGRRGRTQAVVGDATGTMRVVWFNQAYLAAQFKTNDKIALSGKVAVYRQQKTIESPEWERVTGEELTHTGGLIPVYRATQGLSQRQLRRIVKEAMERFVSLLEDPLSDDLLRRHALTALIPAVRQAHFPDDQEAREKARHRLAFEELLYVQLVVLNRRAAWEEGMAPEFPADPLLDRYIRSLPFSLTGAQERVLAEITADLATTRPMGRLLQGDVGSGKTAVAAGSLVLAVANGYQGALMAPTEILAEQHFRTISSLLGGLELNGRRLRVELLTGSSKAAQRREILTAVSNGEIDVLVGTHALVQEGVSFGRLGIAVVDEQHRFGVMQRAALREPSLTGEGKTPHLLAMSATPIPRTLALTFFGDLDVSVLDEMPPGRMPVKTVWAAPDQREQSYSFVRDQIKKGRQTFVVCPLIEESQALQTRSAVQEYERLSGEVFPDFRLGLLHGRMPTAEKDAILAGFRDGDLDILVATTVIEVGIDIPNASVMVIEGADRFGLAQLHQLRGRVGRGAEQSFCLLLSDDPSQAARERLQLLEELNDGFALAEADLRLRGPGDYLGTRQSGLPELQAADLSDVKLIEVARQEAMNILKDDPGLKKGEHDLVAAATQRMTKVVSGEMS